MKTKNIPVYSGLEKRERRGIIQQNGSSIVLDTNLILLYSDDVFLLYRVLYYQSTVAVRPILAVTC